MTENQSENKADAPKRYHFFLRTFFCVLLIPTTAWASLAIYYSNLPGLYLRVLCTILFVTVALSIAFWAKSFGCNQSSAMLLRSILMLLLSDRGTVFDSSARCDTAESNPSRRLRTPPVNSTLLERRQRAIASLCLPYDL